MKDQNVTPKWLTQLQQKSWEPEILLSGIVLFGLFNMPELLDRSLIYFKTNIFGQTTDIDNMVTVLKLATYWLIGGLILHLVSRGVWVGMVGLSYTFPGGVDTSKLSYKGRFKNKVENIPTFQRIIMNLEKICSSLFSVSFMMFMVMIGAYLYIFIAALIPFFTILFITNSWDHWLMQVFGYYTVGIVVVGLLGIIDFLTLGYFRRFKGIAVIYWPFHKFISVLTLSRYYRGIYYGLVSNINKWYIFIGLTAFTLINIVAFDKVISGRSQGINFSRISLWHSTNGFSAFSGYYDDQNEDNYSIRASIPSDIIDENTVRLFIAANIGLEDSILAYQNRDGFDVEMDSLSRPAKSLELVRAFYHIYLDDSLVSGYPMRFHFKTHTRQMGYLVYLDITDLESGLHEISIGGPPSMFRDRRWAQIPFYRERRDIPFSSNEPDKDEDEKGLRSVKPLIIN